MRDSLGLAQHKACRNHGWIALRRRHADEIFSFVGVAGSFVFCGLGTAIGSLLQDMQGFQLIMNFIVMPIFFLSGALFPLTNLPKILDIATKLDPLSYGVDGLRGALIGITHYGLVTNISALGLAAVLFLAIGGYFFSKIQI